MSKAVPLFGFGGSPSTGLPKFTYTGEFQLVDEGNKNWKLTLLTGGKLNFTNLGTGRNGIDVFCVGGGGGGGYNNGYGGGGGGGYTTTARGLSVKTYTEYDIVVGAGGAAYTDGGDTSAFSVVAKGGKTGGPEGAGGNGGSGGGGYSGNYGTGGNGGSDGSNGAAGNASSAGIGQKSTTREFNEETGTLYAGGGGGGGQGSGGRGGDGGGGNGAPAVSPGVTNTGGGGGGGTGNVDAGAGGSGVVIIRNKR